jgi:hypothetical protein
LVPQVLQAQAVVVTEVLAVILLLVLSVLEAVAEQVAVV